MATASEGEGQFDETDKDNFISRGLQVDMEVPCLHSFSINMLKSLCENPQSVVPENIHTPPRMVNGNS